MRISPLNSGAEYDIIRNMRTYILITSIIFSVMGVLQFARIFYAWPAQIGGVQVPILVSWVALVVAWSPGFYGWKLIKGLQ